MSANFKSTNAVVQNAVVARNAAGRFHEHKDFGVGSVNKTVANAMAARNALAVNANMVPPDDPEAAKRFKAFEQKVASLRKEAQELDKYLVSKKQYGYSAYLEGIVKGLH